MFDAIVIGSGFGGAISACRAAEKGMKVLVLERGRRWTPEQFPRKAGDPWLFSSRRPARRNGWLDLRFFRNMTVAQGAGVGGGSLVYSSVAVEAHPLLFQEGWPADITYDELKPHYDAVTRMMNLQTVPDGQLTQRFKLAREAAQAVGHADRLVKTPLAVTFSPNWNYELDEPFDQKHSEQITNAQGQRQGTCIHLGNCDIGCDVQAKNTLDLNYLAQAEQHGAEIRPLHIVRSILPDASGYKVVFDRIQDGDLIRGEERASHVFLAAGSLGSTELLLRCRDEHQTLSNLSRRLGHGWSANANVLSIAEYADGARVQQTWGPTISGMLDYMDGSVGGERFVVEDDGFPNLLLNALRAGGRDGGGGGKVARAVRDRIEAHVTGDVGSRNVMVWLGAGMDAADGRLTLRRPFFAPWQRRLDLGWNPQRSTGVVEAIRTVHKQLTEATGGRLRPDVAWSVFRSLTTLHPLGGCRMGATGEDGVVDHLGKVFGYPNMHVVDGSLLPSSTGRNPSHTIAAMAERIVANIH